MAGMKPCSLQYKALEPKEIINKERLFHSAEHVSEQEYNKQFGLLIERDTWQGIKRDWTYESVPYWKDMPRTYPFSKSN